MSASYRLGQYAEVVLLVQPLFSDALPAIVEFVNVTQLDGWMGYISFL